MIRTWRRLAPLSLLALALVVSGCERPGGEAALVPTEPQPILGLGGLLGGESVQGYELVKDPLLPGLLDLRVSGLIGVEGGELHLLGHSLLVPRGAVSSPTLFSIVVLPTGYVEVELLATVSSLLGGLLDVGGNGFHEPVPVTLTYSRATNVGDPSELVVLRMKGLLGYSRYEVMPSVVDLEAQTVTAELDHFSRYTLATPY